MGTRTFDDLLGRIRSEYVEMPGLWLTTEQAVRLWGIEHEECVQLLRALVAHGFLVVRPDGKYGRATERQESLDRDVTGVPFDANAPINPPAARRLP